MGTRPITDRAKETIFNIIGHRLGILSDLSDVRVLDLFAGSGGFGIECLSRGASSCLFVERDKRAIRALRSNLEKLRLTDVASVSTDNAWTMRTPVVDGGYDLVFVDPPYRDVSDTHRMSSLLERLAPRLSENGLIIFRYERTTRFATDGLHQLVCVDDRTIGTMRIVLLQRGARQENSLAAPNE